MVVWRSHLLPVASLLFVIGFSGRSAAESASTSTTPAVVGISSGIEHTCSWHADGSARCWGRNDAGQLGDGTTTHRPKPTKVASLSGVKALTAGTQHTCALLDDGGVRCWGKNQAGQVGDGTVIDRLTPVPVLGIAPVTQIAAGHQSTCALLTEGGVACWGWNMYGQIGDGTKTNRGTPTKVKGLDPAIQIGVGGGHACALMNDGTARCWGRNDWGQLGIGREGKRHSRARPTPVAALIDAVELSVGFGQACARFGDGSAACWGGSDRGQLGTGKFRNQTTPEVIPGLVGATGLRISGGHLCILGNGEARCLGDNSKGQLGTGSKSPAVRKLSAHPTLVGVKDLSLGAEFSCALTSSGRIMCWGSNEFGQLGDGQHSDRVKPSAVAM